MKSIVIQILTCIATLIFVFLLTVVVILIRGVEITTDECILYVTFMLVVNATTLSFYDSISKHNNKKIGG